LIRQRFLRLLAPPEGQPSGMNIAAFRISLNNPEAD
jgi:hypothetical protein